MSDCRFGVSPVNYPDPDPELLKDQTENSKVTSSQPFTCRLDKSFFLLQTLVENVSSIFKDCLRKHFQEISETPTRARLDYALLCNCHKVSNFRDSI